MKITYVTEDPAPEYQKALRAAKTPLELLDAVKEYREVAEDAISAVAKMTQADFEEFKQDLKKVSKAEGEEAN